MRRAKTRYLFIRFGSAVPTISFKLVKLGRGRPVALVRLDRALNDRVDIVLSYSPTGHSRICANSGGNIDDQLEQRLEGPAQPSEVEIIANSSARFQVWEPRVFCPSGGRAGGNSRCWAAV